MHSYIIKKLSFIYRNPNAAGLYEWPRFTSTSSRYLVMGQEGYTTRDSLREGYCNVWDQVQPWITRQREWERSWWRSVQIIYFSCVFTSLLYYSAIEWWFFIMQNETTLLFIMIIIIKKSFTITLDIDQLSSTLRNTWLREGKII